jgi:hypothetical protein
MTTDRCKTRTEAVFMTHLQKGLEKSSTVSMLFRMTGPKEPKKLISLCGLNGSTKYIGKALQKTQPKVCLVDS